MSNTAAGVIAALARIPGTKLDVCRNLGITPPTLDRWRKGVGEPSESNLARLARHAGVDQEWIRNGGQDAAEG